MFRAIRAVLAGNPNFLVFVTGFSLVLWGVAQVSVPLAAGVAGLILMVIAAHPFVRRPKRD